MQAEPALIALGHALRAEGYQFVTVTPETQRRVLARHPGPAKCLRDIFGWSRPFEKEALKGALFGLLSEADALSQVDGLYRSEVRFSSLQGELFVHSAYPTTSSDAVFFGPDTYRFCAAIAREERPPGRVVDIGCGSGAGGLLAARMANRVVLADINPRALAYARVNAALTERSDVEVVESDVLAQVDGPIDFVVANPPYMRDEQHRTYRDGGGQLGEQLSLRILREACDRLAPSGKLLLYTGAAVVDGHDVFLRAARPLLEEAKMTYRYEEIDPDVFGEELDKPGYAAVERIAAVVLTATRSKE